MGCWHGYLFGARCRFAYGPADPTATHSLLLQEIQFGFGFTFLVLADLGSPGQNPESRKTVVVVVVIQASLIHVLFGWLASLLFAVFAHDVFYTFKFNSCLFLPYEVNLP